MELGRKTPRLVEQLCADVHEFPREKFDLIQEYINQLPAGERQDVLLTVEHAVYSVKRARDFKSYKTRYTTSDEVRTTALEAAEATGIFLFSDFINEYMPAYPCPSKWYESEYKYFRDISSDEHTVKLLLAAPETPPQKSFTLFNNQETTSAQKEHDIVKEDEMRTALAALQIHAHMADSALYHAVYGNSQQRKRLQAFNDELTNAAHTLDSIYGYTKLYDKRYDMFKAVRENGALDSEEYRILHNLHNGIGKYISSVTQSGILRHLIRASFAAKNAYQTGEWDVFRQEFIDEHTAEDQRAVTKTVAHQKLSTLVVRSAAETDARPTKPKLLSVAELKSRGLRDAQGALVKGVFDKDNTLLMPGIPKNDARQYITNVEYLRELIAAGGIPEDNELISDFVDQLRSEWVGVSYAITEYWQNGTEVVATLKSVLFPNNEEINKSPLDTKETNEVSQEPEIRLGKDSHSIPQPVLREPEVMPEDVQILIRDEVIDHQPHKTQLPDVATIGEAKRLEEVILPPKATIHELRAIIKDGDLSDGQIQTIDWQRLHDLVTLRDRHNGILYRSSAGDLGGSPPYFVAELDIYGQKIAVAESPVYGNATYIVVEKLAPGNWREVLALSKPETLEIGAVRIVHRGKQAQRNHLPKIEDKIIDLMTIEP